MNLPNVLIVIFIAYLIVVMFIYFYQRNLLYHPSENNYLDEEQKVEEKLEAEKEYSLRFVFTGESWVEVKDIQGNKILSRINPSNTEKIVYGIPPFSLIIGNAVDVKLFYNNKPVDLIPYTNKNGGVARLSLD